ncbi:MAG: hypothetical protein MIO92_03145 [Methanosarcinaceae archaeon]|nr:hypothetical protein [Methanosarcinaceae archaeon]
MTEKERERLLHLAVSALDEWEAMEMVSAGYYLSSGEEVELEELILKYKKGND